MFLLSPFSRGRVSPSSLATTDMLSAASFYKTLRKDMLPEGTRTAFLGGAFLSWASDREAQDWDIYVPEKFQGDLEQRHGYRFVNLKSYRNTDWLVSTLPKKEKEQLILVPDTCFPVWDKFDYLHCMIGVVDGGTVVDVGVGPAAKGWLLKNPLVLTRSMGEVSTKLANKSVFGSGDLENVKGTIAKFVELISEDKDGGWDNKDLSFLKEGPQTLSSVELMPSPGICYVCSSPALVTRDTYGVPTCGGCR